MTNNEWKNSIEEWRKAMISYLILKGEWGTYTQEIQGLMDWSGQSKQLCTSVVNWCKKNEKIKLVYSIQDVIKEWLAKEATRHKTLRKNYTVYTSERGQELLNQAPIDEMKEYKY